MLTLVGISFSLFFTKDLVGMQEAVHEDQASSSVQASQGSKKYTLADIAVVIAYTSDQQEGNAEQAAKKEGFDEMSPALFSRWPHATKIEIRAGDLIDGKETHGALRAFFGATIAHALTTKSGRAAVTEQADHAKEKIEIFEQTTGVVVLLGLGNHGFYAIQYIIPERIIKKQGNLRSVHRLKNPDGSDSPLHIILCGFCTDHKTCQWIKQQFNTIKKTAGYETPVTLVTHADEHMGNNKAWLSDADIKEYTDTLNTYGNVQELATGHGHASDITYWQPDGPDGKTYFVNRAGGDKKIVSLYDAQGNRLDTLFFKAQKISEGVYEPVEVEPVIVNPTPKSAWDDGIKRMWNKKVIDQWYNEK